MNETPHSPPLFLTARQLADRLGFSVGRVRLLAKSGRIPEIRVGVHTRRYNLDQVIVALTEKEEGGR